jgi:hypothetical protein
MLTRLELLYAHLIAKIYRFHSETGFSGHAARHELIVDVVCQLELTLLPILCIISMLLSLIERDEPA